MLTAAAPPWSMAWRACRAASVTDGSMHAGDMHRDITGLSRGNADLTTHLPNSVTAAFLMKGFISFLISCIVVMLSCGSSCSSSSSSCSPTACAACAACRLRTNSSASSAVPRGCASCHSVTAAMILPSSGPGLDKPAAFCTCEGQAIHLLTDQACHSLSVVLHVYLVLPCLLAAQDSTAPQQASCGSWRLAA